MNSIQFENLTDIYIVLTRIVIPFFLAIGLIIYHAICYYSVFQRMGEKGGIAFAPFYREVVMVDDVVGGGWLILGILRMAIVLTPFVGAWRREKLAKAFGLKRGQVFVFVVFPDFMLPKLAFGKCAYTLTNRNGKTGPFLSNRDKKMRETRKRAARNENDYNLTVERGDSRRNDTVA